MPATSRPPLRLRVTRPGVARLIPTPAAMGPWWAVAVAGGLLAALAGWLITAGVVMLGWVSALQGSPLDALRVGTQAWLLAHGAGAAIGALRVSLTPLLLTLLLGLGVHTAAAFAARHRLAAAGEEGIEPRVLPTVLAQVAATVAGTYAGAVTLAAIVMAPPGQALRAAVLAVLLAATASLVGAAGALRWRPWRGWPLWARALPKAVGLAVAVALAGGALAVLAGLVMHRDRVAAIASSLHAPPLGVVVLVLGQLLWLPTIVLCGTAYVLGGGFSLGGGTVVSIGNVHVGMLPAVPVLGAVPANGPGGGLAVWWLLVGVAAGAVAGYVVVISRPRARADETALVGGLAGLLAALAVVALAVLARGDLGVARLAGVGPRLKELTILAGSLMGLSGLLAGAVLGLLRRPTRASVTDDELGLAGRDGAGGHDPR